MGSYKPLIGVTTIVTLIMASLITTHEPSESQRAESSFLAL